MAKSVLRSRSNPAFRSSAFTTDVFTGEGTMTLAGTTAKTFVLLALTFASTLYTWFKVAPTEQAGTVTLVGAVGGLAVALVTIFSPRVVKYTAPVYAVLEGLALGGISAMLTAVPKYHGIPAQATALTFLVTFVMLGLYATRIIRATEMVKAVIVNATLAVFVYYMLDLVLSFFGVRMPFMAINHSMGGFIVNLVVCGIAAFNLILDFDYIEQGVQRGFGKSAEWYGAFSLLVTLVWLWLELVRLLLRRR